MNLLQLYVSNILAFIGFNLIIIWTLIFVFGIFRSILSTLIVLIKGYPPAHCSALGELNSSTEEPESE